MLINKAVVSNVFFMVTPWCLGKVISCLSIHRLYLCLIGLQALSWLFGFFMVMAPWHWGLWKWIVKLNQ